MVHSGVLTGTWVRWPVPALPVWTRPWACVSGSPVQPAPCGGCCGDGAQWYLLPERRAHDINSLGRERFRVETQSWNWPLGFFCHLFLSFYGHLKRDNVVEMNVSRTFYFRKNLLILEHELANLFSKGTYWKYFRLWGPVQRQAARDSVWVLGCACLTLDSPKWAAAGFGLRPLVR